MTDPAPVVSLPRWLAPACAEVLYNIDMLDVTGEENDVLLTVKIVPGAWKEHSVTDEVVSRSRLGACFAPKYNQDYPDDSSGGSCGAGDRVILSDCYRIRCGKPAVRLTPPARSSRPTARELPSYFAQSGTDC